MEAGELPPLCIRCAVLRRGRLVPCACSGEVPAGSRWPGARGGSDTRVGERAGGRLESLRTAAGSRHRARHRLLPRNPGLRGRGLGMGGQARSLAGHALLNRPSRRVKDSALPGTAPVLFRRRLRRGVGPAPQYIPVLVRDVLANDSCAYGLAVLLDLASRASRATPSGQREPPRVKVTVSSHGDRPCRRKARRTPYIRPVTKL